MANAEENQLATKVELLWNVASNRAWSVKFQHWVGYGLLILTSFDLIAIFVPPNFTNPLWEFQALGNLVEMVAVPLIGLALVYPGKRDGRPKWELKILKYLSNLMLLAGILYWLLIPLGIMNTMRIDRQNNQQITGRFDQEITQVQRLQEKLASVTTLEQMDQLLSTIEQNGRAPEITSLEDLASAKAELADSLTKGQDRLKTQAQATRSGQRLDLLKRSVKWNLGALVSGALFICLWRGTGWSRSR
ncbi:MAG: HpsJ family protein [Thermosynechococcaceae cyanobacterium]